MNKVKSVSVRLATPDDAHLFRYTNSNLVSMNTCPTLAIVKDQMQLGYASNARAMALEAGAAMHEMFAAVRLWQLWKHDLGEAGNATISDPIPTLIMHHGNRLFGQERFETMLEQAPGASAEDERTQCLNFCLQALYSSGFYDDPSDARRTMSNLEEAAIMYIDRWDFKRHPIWIRDINDPESDVGIEIKFDVVITYEFEDFRADDEGSPRPTASYLFSGTLDGLHLRDGHLVIGENKTASRLDEAWRQSFEMSSQITGYALAGTVFTQQPINKGVVWGLQIPLPKSYAYGGLIVEPITRESFKTERWFEWFLYTVQQYEAYRDNPHNAPKFTHSCNRYFRPCHLIPFCASDDDDQKQALTEMVHLEDRYEDLKGGD